MPVIAYLSVLVICSPTDNRYIRRMNRQTNCFLSLGSNLGDNESLLNEAVRHLQKQDCRIIRISGFYKTKAWGKTDQPDFLNAVVEISTGLPADELMSRILQIETEMGRKRQEKWGPRTIDIDILFYGNQIIESEKLIIPHPQLHLRRFVLVPLNELAPDFLHPLFLRPIHQLLQECTDISEPILLIQ